jgi:chemotaxis protein histidine kinase CheA
MDNLPLFDITLEDFEQGMYKISLVDKPAIEENFIYFNEVKKIEMFSNEEKKEVVGPIMIPNKEILRFSPDMGYYYVRFTEETIRQIMYNYSKKGLFNAFGIDHAHDTEDVVMLEVWMKESENDKSKDYGYDLPNGTVFVKAKIESDELFTAIKTGEINGFSIEIKADIKPTNNNEQMNEFAFAKELGKLEAQFEAMANKYEARIEALENENNVLLEALTSFEEKYAGVEDLKAAVEMIQKHIEGMSTSEEMSADADADDEKKDEEMMGEDKKEQAYEATEEVVEEVTEEFEAASKEVEEQLSAEEEVNETEVEEAFAAQQKEVEAEESTEDKTVVFDAITPEKMDIINSFFKRK